MENNSQSEVILNVGETNRTVDTVKTADAFSNPMARLGYGTQNLMEASEYPLTRLTQNYALLNSLYRSNWIVQNIIGTIPEDVTKKWFRVTSNISPELLEKINKQQRQIKLRKAISDGMKWGRLYGGALGLILIDGQQDMLSEPLDYNSIMPDSFKGLFIVDRWSGVYPDMELISDINDPEFGLPKYYEIRDEKGSFTQRVHYSRVVRFVGRELPFWEKIVELYWGQSELEAIYDEIVKRDNVSFNIASLTFRANLDVMEMDNLDQMFAVGGTQVQRKFWDRMQAQSIVQSNLGLMLINKGDAVHKNQYTFTGLAEVYENIMLDVAGAARMPVTKLFGRSPAGMNSTGESDLQNYYDYLEEVRESKFRPIIEKLLPIMALSAWGEIPDDLDFVFDSMWSPTEEQKAGIIRQKVAALIEVFKAGGITQDAFMKELRVLSTSYGMFDTITNEMIKQGEGVWARDLEMMNDPFAGLMAGGSNGGFGGTNDYEDLSTTDYDPNQAREPDGKFGNGGGDTQSSKENPNFSDDVNKIFDSILSEENAYIKADVGDIDDRLINEAKENGYNLEGYKHNIDTYGVKHTLKNHGNKDKEEKRGQIAVTKRDIEQIPDIVYNYDSVKFGEKNKIGREILVFSKKMSDGTTVYVEEIRTGNKELTLNSMRKHK